MVIEYFEYDFEYVVLFKYVFFCVGIVNYGIIYLVGGEQFFVIDFRGYVYIVDCLVGMFLEFRDFCLQLNIIVEEIKWSENGVNVVIDNGDVYNVDYVLLIFSIGVLQSGLVMFIF